MKLKWDVEGSRMQRKGLSVASRSRGVAWRGLRLEMERRIVTVTRASGTYQLKVRFMPTHQDRATCAAESVFVCALGKNCRSSGDDA